MVRVSSHFDYISDRARYDKDIAWQHRINAQNDILIRTRDIYKNVDSTSSREIPWMDNEISRITNVNYGLRSGIDNLKRDISTLNTQNFNLEFDNKTHGATINTLRDEEQKEEHEYADKRNKTHAKRKEILPLKKKEMVGTKKYHQLLMFQNQEIKDEIYSQKNDLTTADRNYSIHDSKIPYYVVVNKILLFTYIAILLYVSYRVLNGMIVNNIYGKIVIILLIALYPIYIFDLEIAIYDQYKLIKSMIRAEPYVPVVI
jgi:hypothetical protein